MMIEGMLENLDNIIVLYQNSFPSLLSEKANGLINYEFLDEKNPSASRTLLRLHRALKMVALLLQKISSDKKEKMSKIAYDSYHECPMPAHHPWVIKKGSLSNRVKISLSTVGHSR